MIKKLLPLFGLMLGLAVGGGAAFLLAPPSADEDTDMANTEAATDARAGTTEQKPLQNTEIVKLPNQFVVPVIVQNRVRAMVILSVALEVDSGMADRVRTLEPKLRDTFLAELFSLAALDGFRDELITRSTLELVKVALTERAKAILELEQVTILITDMIRQDAF